MHGLLAGSVEDLEPRKRLTELPCSEAKDTKEALDENPKVREELANLSIDFGGSGGFLKILKGDV